MNRIFCLALVVLVFGIILSSAQTTLIEPTPTPVRLVVTDPMPRINSSITSVKPQIVVGSQTDPIKLPTTAEITNLPATENLRFRSLNFAQLKSRIAEAKRQMLSRPIATVSSESVVNSEFVRIAFLDWKTNQIDYVVMTKDGYLSTACDKQAVSQNGKSLIARTIRANGVNTPIALISEDGETYLPLMVQYPVVREGKYIETAYYMSTHPGLVTPEVVNAGKYYIRNVIELAREKLRERGVTIQPKVADIAERLSAVEHVDHLRFKTEYQPNVFSDIYTLYALNEGQTYRYSVSSAGAGGMVQMIPSTYRLIRNLYPNVPLMPDFVEGMRNHVNASQAMLLYMQSTWNDLISRPTVADALLSGIATQEQLMAAGYNSNPAKLSGYISRGGEGWTNLIPRETKIYLQIYDSMERFVPIVPRTR